MIQSINPATGEKLKSFEPLSDLEIEEKLALAERTFRQYRRTSFPERTRMMLRAAEILESEKEAFGRIMTLEMGKPIKAGVEEAAKCAQGCRYYAANAERLLADEIVEPENSAGDRAFIRFQPLGAVLAIMPWNFPFWQVFRFAAPALMAGNVGLLKHASNVPQCALAIADILERAGFPRGAFQTLLVGSDKVENLIADRRVVAVTLTGSEPAGRRVASAAGKHIKKSVLELGGSDPFIVLPGASMDRAVKTAVKARTINNGQSCIAAKRFIIHERIAGEFMEKFVRGMEALKIGDPVDGETELGPLATPAILEDLEKQVKQSVAAGARVLTGGSRLERKGNYYAPTVLTDIPKASPAYKEEFFGPVALLFRVRDLSEAIELANDTSFGLGASAWTDDAEEQTRLIDELEAGLVFINGMVASEPGLPFGGVKNSGYGRELSAAGIHEFVNVKTVRVRAFTA